MHYYHYKLKEVLELDMITYNCLYEAMSTNQSRNQLKMLEVVSYPNMTKDAKNETFRKYNKNSYPDDFKPKNIVSLGDLSRVLNG
jgi:hypothetical protein